MSIDKRNRKFDLDELIEDTFKEISAITDSDKSVGLKTQSFKRLATKIVNRLFGERARKNKATSLTLNTANRYLTKIRNEITAKGWKHHSFEKSVDRIVANHPCSAYMIDNLSDLSLEQTRVKVKSVRNKLAQSERLTSRLEKLDQSSSTYASTVNAIAKDFPLWAYELGSLKTLNASDRAAAMDRVNMIIDESKSLYNELSSLKIDHEIMRHLTKDHFTKKAFDDANTEVLNIKKSNTINIDYPTLMSRVEFLLTPIHPGLWTWEALATGVSFATGRRDIEVLVQGRFTKTGKHTFKFSGQAKERGGIDYENQFDIYSLIETDKVLAAIDLLRKKPNVAQMVSYLSSIDETRHYQFNELVHNRTAGPLNKFMNEFMAGAGFTTGGLGRNWTSKDTRAIYAAICFKLFFEEDERWKNKDQDLFFQELLGHSDGKAQAHYKAFKITKAGQKWEAIKADKDRLAELKKLDSDERITGNEAYARIHEAVKQIITQDPGVKNISQRKVKDECGGNFKTIKFYLEEIAASALSFDTDLDSLLKKEVETGTNRATKPEEPLAEKVIDNDSHERPTIKPKALGNNRWEVTIVHKGQEHVELVDDANNMMDAGKQAIEQLQAKNALPDTPPDPVVSKDKGMWHSRIIIRGQSICEAWNPSKKAATDASRAMYKAMKE
ncbi:hypothetical protein N2V14_004084 [Vibrio fluvialis]|nr:hypothetical protein [Vibrio fluvialis]